MKIFSLCLTFIFGSHAIFAQTDLHKSALSYYIKITNNTKDSYYSMSNSAQILTNYTSLASQTDSFKLDSLRVDTLKNSFSQLTSTLQSNIHKLDSIIEIDPVISLKDSVKSIYKEAILAFNKIFPKFINLFELGYKSTSKEEISNYWDEYQNDMKAISDKLNTLGKNTSVFLTKYGITDSELKQNGL